MKNTRRIREQRIPKNPGLTFNNAGEVIAEVMKGFGLHPEQILEVFAEEDRYFFSENFNSFGIYIFDNQNYRIATKGDDFEGRGMEEFRNDLEAALGDYFDRSEGGSDEMEEEEVENTPEEDEADLWGGDSEDSGWSEEEESENPADTEGEEQFESYSKRAKRIKENMKKRLKKESVLNINGQPVKTFNEVLVGDELYASGGFVGNVVKVAPTLEECTSTADPADLPYFDEFDWVLVDVGSGWIEAKVYGEDRTWVYAEEEF